MIICLFDHCLLDADTLILLWFGKYANWTPGQEAETLHGRETATSERVSVFRQGERESQAANRT